MPIDDALKNLRRPKSLLHAAQICARNHPRALILKHLLGQESYRAGPSLLSYLLSEEQRINLLRQQGARSYHPQRHILLLGAILNEIPKCVAD